MELLVFLGLEQVHWLNFLALTWFLICIKGYGRYARFKSKTRPCLVNVLHLHRINWMRQLLQRDVRVADIAAIANLERSVGFFASSTLILLAGLLTVFSASEQAVTLLSEFPLVMDTSRVEWELKLVVLIALFIYAFFKFTWSLRQYGFASVLIGSAPQHAASTNEAQCELFIHRTAKIETMAANNFNNGLRAYYFSLALLGWVMNPWVLIAMSTGVVYVLYQREFRSSTLHTLMAGLEESRILGSSYQQLAVD
ncbi:MAG: putative membrane protein [Motiliproteus sp.]|jgi:uncharacterized membrane protein